MAVDGAGIAANEELPSYGFFFSRKGRNVSSSAVPRRRTGFV
jgi:hypothetical protein